MGFWFLAVYASAAILAATLMPAHAMIVAPTHASNCAFTLISFLGFADAFLSLGFFLVGVESSRRVNAVSVLFPKAVRIN